MRFYTSSFNGKEKDLESGFHYYGARYYWSELLTGWLTVDPMMDKYPSISPYAYCAWNPVKLVDPDGRDIWEVDENGIVRNTGD
jgi:RHS repeat-associated protein